jgi:hypothetical protein
VNCYCRPKASANTAVMWERSRALFSSPVHRYARLLQWTHGDTWQSRGRIQTRHDPRIAALRVGTGWPVALFARHP